MKVDQKTYAQVVVVGPQDFIFSHVYREYEAICPFLCFAGIFAADFRTSLKNAEAVVRDKDVILILEEYWAQLSTEEKKAVLDHELGHIANGDLKKVEDYIRKYGKSPPNEVSLLEEKAADAYSANINGNQAMHHSLIKAVDVMLGAHRKKGYRVTVEQIIQADPILKTRLEVLSRQPAQ